MSLLDSVENAIDADEGDNPNDVPEIVTAPDEPDSEVAQEPESPDSPEMGVVAEEKATTPPTAGLTKDAEGRWRRPDGTFASKAEIEGKPTIEAPKGEATPVTPEAPPPTPPQPFTYRANRQTHPLEGALQNPDGSVVITPEGLNGLRTLLADAHSFRSTYPQERSQWQQRVKQAESLGTEKVQRAEAMAAEIDKIMESADSVIEFVQNFETNKAALYARAEARVLKQQLEELRSGKAQPNAGEASQQEIITEDALKSDLGGALEDVFEVGEYKTLFQPADRERIAGRLGQMVTRGLYFQAERDFTEEEVRIMGFDVPGGIMKGAVLLDEKALMKEIEYEASLIKQYRSEAQKQAKEALEAKQFNAARKVPTGTPTRTATTPPPSVSASTPAPSNEHQPAGSYDAWLKKMGLNG